MATARDLTFGFFHPHWLGAMGGQTPRGDDIIELARLAEQSGFDTVWVADHLCFEPYADRLANGAQPPESLRGVKIGVWECWTLLGALAVATERATIGTLVTNTGFRNPALLAHMANTVDELSHGRLILGLGAGDYPSEYHMHGYPWERRIARFEEALGIIRPLLRGESVTVTGEFYAAREAKLAVKASRAEGPPIMIGVVQGGRRMQRLVAQFAEIWDCFLAFFDNRPEAYSAQRAAMDATCERYGRDPASLRRQVTVGVAQPGHDWGSPGTPLTGSPAAVAEQLVAFAEQGVSHVCIYAQPKTAAGIEWLARVIESVRA